MLDGQLRRLNLQDKTRERQIIREWPGVAGVRTAEHARPVRYSEWTLVVRVDSSVWMQELTYHKSRYAEELNRRLGAYLVREVRLELGELPPDPRLLRVGLKEESEEQGEPIPPEVVADIDRQVADLLDPELQRSARRMMETQYRSRLARRTRRPPRR